MPQTIKVLGQLRPAGNTLTAAYTVPAGTSTVISSIVVSNPAPGGNSFSLSVAINGAADTAAQYLAVFVPIGGQETLEIARGITLGPGDVIRVLSNTIGLTFNIFGQENS